LCANTLEHGVSPDTFCQVFDARNTFFPAFGYDLGRTELSRKFFASIRGSSWR
jgi:hypothetical protein